MRRCCGGVPLDPRLDPKHNPDNPSTMASLILQEQRRHRTRAALVGRFGDQLIVLEIDFEIVLEIDVVGSRSAALPSETSMVPIFR